MRNIICCNGRNARHANKASPRRAGLTRLGEWGHEMRLEPLGDQAVMAYCTDEAHASAVGAQAREAAPSWCVDVVQAYTSVAVYYDFGLVDFATAAAWLAQFGGAATSTMTGPLREIPCCYELGLDFDRIQAYTGLTRDQIISMHSSTEYTVYAIGFCPGFPYLGYLPEKLSAVPRLDSPRLKVEAGSVGLTGRQTGIYTEARPGGWNIVARTPLELVNVKDEYFPLRTGDRVRFRPIRERDFKKMKGNRLT